MDTTYQSDVVLYGNDTGANNVLDLVESAAQQCPAIVIHRVSGSADSVREDVLRQIKSCDAVVFGVSSYMPEAQIASEALKSNPSLSGKILFIQDGPGSSGIQDLQLRAIGKSAHLSTVLAEPEHAPERAVYQSVHTVGYPDYWYPSMQAILDAAGLRQNSSLTLRHQTSRETRPLTQDDIVIYLSGFKDPFSEKRAIEELLSIQAPQGKQLHVHFRAHPGERSRQKPDQDSAAFNRAIEERDALLADQWDISDPEVIDAGSFTDSKLIGASDITFTHPGATSKHFAAALRLRMVSCMEMVAPDFQSASSSQNYEMARHCLHMIQHYNELAAAVLALTDADSAISQDLRTKQEANALPFDPTQKPQYGQKVLQILQQILSAK